MKAISALSLKVKIIIAACTAAVVAAVVTVALILSSEDAYRVIKVFELEGQTLVDRAQTGELEAYQGMNLESGDVVSVGSDSFLRLSLDGDKYILLDSGTVLELIASGTAADSKTVINLKEGSILNEITGALSANSSYTVNTPKATMAVRGTSFRVTVERTEDGGYITRVDTIHGKVLVTLYDESGNEIKAEATVTEGNGVIIITDPNGETGNAPEVDGNAYFVFVNEDGSYVPCGENDPVHISDYGTFSERMRTVALNSNDSRLLLLDSRIAERLRGTGSVTEETTETTAESESMTGETSADSETQTSHESTADTISAAVSRTDEPRVTEAPEPLALDVPAVTTAPAVTEDMPVYPSELTSAAVTETAVTEAVTAAKTVPETFVTTVKVTAKTTTAKTTTEKVTTAKTTPVTASASVPPPHIYIPAAPVTTPPIVTPTVTTTGTTAEETTAEIISHLVQFINGSDVTKLELEDGKPLGALPEIPPKPGHTAKWVCGTDEVTAATVVTEDMNITAVYTPIKYTVKFSDGTADTEREIDYGETLGTLPAITPKAGHTAKWVCGTDEVTAATVVTEDMNITAVYTPIKYTVKFSDGTADTEREIDYGETLGTLPAITPKAGHTAKWVCSGSNVTAATVVTEDMNITAKYTPIKVKIHINAPTPPIAGNTYSDVYTFEVDYGSTVDKNTIDGYIAQLDSQYSGTPTGSYKYKFKSATLSGGAGDDVSNGFEVSGNNVEDISGSPYVRICLNYSQYFTVTFKDDSNQTVLEFDAFIYDTIGDHCPSLPEIPDKTGYTSKWVSNGDDVTADKTILQDMTVEPRYSPLPVEIRAYAKWTTDGDYTPAGTDTGYYDTSFSIDTFKSQVDASYSGHTSCTIAYDAGLFQTVSGTLTLTGDRIQTDAAAGKLYIDIYFCYST